MDKNAHYTVILEEIRALTRGVQDRSANYANAAAVIYDKLPEINWAGFYLLKDGRLVLGPFQGKPACVYIEPGKGVCGTAAQQMRTRVVKDVRDFPGHIACDASSRSEIVVPLVREDALIGVLDIDSPRKGRFDERDRKYCEEIARILTQIPEKP
jgi:GAF domain-containing protein